MRIIFLIRSLNYGGSERQIVTLAKGLHERGHSVLVSVFYPNGPLEKDLCVAGIPIMILEKKGRWDIFPPLLRLVRFVNKEKPDILHGYLGIPNIFAMLLKPIFPKIQVVWAVRASNVDFNRYDWLARLSYQVELRLSHFTDLIIVNSHTGFDYAVAHGFPKNKMVVIPNGIDTERFRPDPEARKRVRAKWDIAENEKLIGLVGRLDPMKDHPTFLKAAALLVQERKDVHFVCIGDGPMDYKTELQSFSKELGLERYLKWTSAGNDISVVYNALDIETSSSYGEGFPNVIGEAMACGIPCVVTDVGDSALIVGDIGVVVPPKNPEALKSGWKLMLMEDRDEIALKGRMRIIEKFNVEQLVKQTESALWLKA